jgi:hypothetical protein
MVGGGLINRSHRLRLLSLLDSVVGLLDAVDAEYWAVGELLPTLYAKLAVPQH